MLTKTLMIALGGAGGAVARYLLSLWMQQKWPMAFPFGTLTVNIAGSFFIGLIYVLIVEKMVLHPDWKNVFIVGFLGAFTTFSTFSLEVVTLIENGRVGAGVLYVVASVMFCLAAAWFAMALARLF